MATMKVTLDEKDLTEAVRAYIKQRFGMDVAHTVVFDVQQGVEVDGLFTNGISAYAEVMKPKENS